MPFITRLLSLVAPAKAGAQRLRCWLSRSCRARHPCRFSIAPSLSSPLRRQGPVTSLVQSTLLRSAASLPYFTRLRRASHLSLCGQRNMAQRKATPMQRSPGILPSDCAKELRGWLTVHPCTGSQLARIPASHPAGFPTFLRRYIGAPGSAHRARQSEQQSQSQSPPHPPCRAPSPAAREKGIQEQSQSLRGSASSLLRTMRSDRGPYVAATWRRESPQGGREGSRPVRCQHTDVLSANLRSRVAQSQGRMPGDRCIGVAFLWAMFLWPHKERWLARPEASEKRHGCRAPQERRKLSMATEVAPTKAYAKERHGFCAPQERKNQQQSHWAPASVKPRLPRACRRAGATMKLLGSFARKTSKQNQTASRAGDMR